MDIEYDHNKDAINLFKHGISLSEAARIDWGTLWAFEDQRHDHGEIRMIGLGLLETRLFCVIYTARGSLRRVINLRKANKREVKSYALNN